MINTNNQSFFVCFRNIARITIKSVKDISRLISSEGAGTAVKAAANAAEGNFYKLFKEERQLEFRRIKNPLEVIYLPVGMINKRISAGATRKYKFKCGYKFHPEYKGTKRINPGNQGAVLGGDWDRYPEKIKISSTYIAFNQRFKGNRRWKDTAYYDCFLKKIHLGGKKRAKGAKNWEEFRQNWLLDKEKIYRDIKNNGYRRQAQIKGGRVENEVEVGVSREGKVLLIDGNHRLSIAKMLGIKEIPVIVKVWHKKYINKIIRKTGLSLERMTPAVGIDSVLEKPRAGLKKEKIKKVSVVVPVFNEGRLISNCIESLLKQSLDKSRYEILVIDDGSTDRTPEVLRKISLEEKIRVITLLSNQGRVIARKVGAEGAAYEDILFIDSRCIVGNNLLSEILKKEYQPLIAGPRHGRGDGQSNPYYRVIDLFRLKYYLAGSSDKFHLIEERNFRRSPKGATCLFIKRNLFLKSLPKKTGRHINDDTRILREVIRHKPILRYADLPVEYIPRENPKQIFRHLFFRGPRFRDYYLSPGGPYRKLFLFSLLIFLVLVMSVFFFPPLFFLYLFFLLLFNFFLAIFLAQNVKDFFLVFSLFPPIAIVFSLGIISGMFIDILQGGRLKTAGRKNIL